MAFFKTTRQPSYRSANSGRRLSGDASRLTRPTGVVAQAVVQLRAHAAVLAGTRRDDASRLWLRIKGWDGELPVSRAFVHLFKAM